MNCTDHLALVAKRLVQLRICTSSHTRLYTPTRLHRYWWLRRGWSGCCRSLLLGRHVDEDDETGALIARSGLCNLHPLPGAPKMSGTNPRTPMGSRRSLYGSAGGSIAQRADRTNSTQGIFTQVRAARMRKTLFLLLVYYVFECSSSRSATVHSSYRQHWARVKSSEPPLRCPWASVYTLKGVTNSGK
jgi:hypothetical protein